MTLEKKNRGAKPTEISTKRAFGRVFSSLAGDSLDSDLANEFDTDPTTIYRWRNGKTLPNGSTLVKIAKKYNVSTDSLLGLASSAFQVNYTSKQYIELKHSTKELVCLLNLPSSLPATTKETLEKAFNAFKIVIENGSDQEAVDKLVFNGLYNTNSWEVVRSDLLKLFQCGFLRFLNIPIDTVLAAKIAAKYGLKEVFVIDIEPSTIFALIRAELIAAFASSTIFNRLSAFENVGIGSGYTLQRFADYSLSNEVEFASQKTFWIPLMSFVKNNNSYMTANRIASLLAAKHNGSRFLSLPFKPKEPKAGTDSAEFYLTYNYKLRAIILTVNGTLRPKLGIPAFEVDMRTSNYKHFRLMDGYFLSLKPEIQRNIAGEILGKLIDDNGQEISPQYDLIRQLSMERLREYGKDSSYPVWLLAGRGYKSRITLAAIKGGLVNSLVIDREIAEALDKPQEHIFEPHNKFWDEALSTKTKY